MLHLGHNAMSVIMVSYMTENYMLDDCLILQLRLTLCGLSLVLYSEGT